MSKRILLVGHCGVDGPRLQSEIGSFLNDADVVRINSATDLKRAVDEGAALLLVNREPLGFQPKDGIDLIREIHAKHPDQKMMLVSDYEDAQEEAEQIGAMPGFGKRDIGSPKFEQTVRAAMGN